MEKTENVNSLQEIINKKASLRLMDDLHKISEFFSGNRLLIGNGNGYPILYRDKNNNGFDIFTEASVSAATFRAKKESELEAASVRSHIWVTKHSTGVQISAKSYAADLYDYWLPIYIQEETESFVTKVEELRDDVDDLLNQRDM